MFEKQYPAEHIVSPPESWKDYFYTSMNKLMKFMWIRQIQNNL